MAKCSKNQAEVTNQVGTVLTKSQTYQLALRVGAERTKAQVYHYRFLRDYIEHGDGGEFKGFGLHYGFGENPVNYAAAVATSSCGGDFKPTITEAQVKAAFQNFTLDPPGVGWTEARKRATEAMNRILAHNTGDMTLEGLRNYIKSIGGLVPVIESGCSHCSGCDK